MEEPNSPDLCVMLAQTNEQSDAQSNAAFRRAPAGRCVNVKFEFECDLRASLGIAARRLPPSLPQFAFESRFRGSEEV